MKSNPKLLLYRIRLERIKQRTWLLVILVKILSILAVPVSYCYGRT